MSSSPNRVRAAWLVATLVLPLSVPALPAAAAGPRLATASHHALAVLGDGTLWGWGLNLHGQLGLGTSGWLDRRPLPVRVGTGLWKDVATSPEHTVALRDDGTLWSCGSNTWRVFGPAFDAVRGSDTLLQISAEEDWVWVGAGAGYSAARKVDGSLWGWGDKLCPGSTPCPRLLSAATGWRDLAPSPGYHHDDLIAAIRADGSLWMIGSYDERRIGTDADWADVSAGGDHFLAVKSDGTLWGWGVNAMGQLGGGLPVTVTAPAPLHGDADWAAVSAGEAHSLGLKRDGSLFAWGANGRGECGAGALAARSGFTAVAGPGGWLLAQGGYLRSFALRADGTLQAWGSNLFGALGGGVTTDFPAPVPIGAPARWRSIDTGMFFSVGVRGDGTLWAWGRNDAGQLGLGDRADRLAPTRVLPGRRWRAVSAGSGHVLALRDDGTVWSWGGNRSGELGRGFGSGLAVLDTPGRVPGTGWIRVSAGFGHSLALRGDGSLWAWGRNVEGQLGTGGSDTDPHPRPRRIGYGWRDVSAGFYDSWGARRNGTAWRWGETHLSGSATPRQVDATAPTRRVVAGASYRFTISGDGTLQPWGFLGYGSPSPPAGSAIPLPDGALRWTGASAGRESASAVASDGSLWSWGRNFDGELGIGAPGSFEEAPVRVGTDADWRRVDVEYHSIESSHALALKADGTLWGWGNNDYGQLGLGVAGYQATPRAVALPAAP